MQVFKILLAIFLFANSLFAFTEINPKVAIEDLKNGNMEKYKQDNLSKFTNEALVKRGIITNEAELTREIPETISKQNIMNSINCSFVGDEWTATIYDIDAKAGIVTCMVAKKGDLYNPVGLFDTHYPNLQKHFKLDLKKAEEENEGLISVVEQQFKPLQDSIETIYNSTKYAANKEYLTIPQLLTAAILTDTDIIDYEATAATNKLQLKDNFASSYYDNSSNEFVDNREYILTDAENLFSVYVGLSDVSMSYLILLVGFFGIWGLGGKFLSHVSSKVEDKQNHEKVSTYTVGLVMGILLFFPTSFKEQITNQNGQVIHEYDLMKTKYQEFERDGYNLFGSWADKASKVILDAEINSIIEKAGVGTKDQIIQTSAGFEQSKKLTDFTNNIQDICNENIFNIPGLKDGNGKYQYSVDPNQPFPISEKWAFVNSRIGGSTSSLYYSVKDGEVRSSSSYNTSVLNKVNANNPLDNYYPVYSLSSCGKNYYNNINFVQKEKDHEEMFYDLNNQGANAGNKIPMLKSIIEFQYELYRDWGYLSVLGLSVTKMQTEYLGGLYKTNRSKLLDKLNEEVKKDSDLGTHMIMSSIPYMFLPGSSTLYKIGSDNAGKVGSAMGGVLGATGGGGIASWFTGTVGSIVGGVAGVAAKNSVGLFFAYQSGKTLLELTPIIGVVIIGLLRFVIIMIKIFSFHFASLFMMPIMFARENIQAISRFTMKIFATMLELPIYVLSVWLAITASSLINTIGDVFGKSMMIGMLENNSVQQSNFLMGWFDKMRLYFFDGLLEIAVAVFSIVIIYKIIVTLHSTLFEVIEIQGSRELDNAIESMKNEGTGWGARL
jgi:hypothetical protein